MKITKFYIYARPPPAYGALHGVHDRCHSQKNTRRKTLKKTNRIFSRFLWAAFVTAMAVMMIGCSALGLSDLPGSTTITGVSATGAVVGSTGKIRVSLLDVATTETLIALTSSNTSVATTAATAKIVAGSRTVDIDYAGVSAGVTVFTATLGTSNQSSSARVVSATQISSITGPVTLQAGAVSALTVNLNYATSTDVAVTLSSSNTAAVSVPTSATVRAFTGSATVAITGGTAGSTAITASIGAEAKTIYLDVATTPSISNLYSSIGNRQQTGTVSTLYVVADMIVAADSTISLVSSNTAVMTVPSALTIQAGMSSGSVSITAAAKGTTILTATMGTSTYRQILFVEDTPVLSSISAPNRMQVGIVAWIGFSYSSAPVSDLAITLSSSNPSVLALPSSFVVDSGATSDSLAVTPIAAGVTLITATLGSSSVSYLIEVVGAPVIQDLYLYPITAYMGQQVSKMEAGAAGVVYVRLESAVADSTAISITNSASTVVSIPSTFNIPMGVNYVMIPITALVAGNANLTFTMNSTARTLSLYVTTTPGFWSFNQTRQPYVGTSGALFLALDSIVASDTVVTLTQTNAAALSVPTTITVPANQNVMYIPVTGLAAGSTTVTATLGAFTKTATINVSAP